MRSILHIGLFVLALTAVGQASADDGHRRNERRTTVVVAPQVAPHTVRRLPGAVTPPRHVSHGAMPPSVRGLLEARREVYEQRRDHDEIVRISNRWEQAARNRDPWAQRIAERQADAWIEREISESNRKPDHGRYVHRLHSLRRQLLLSNRWHSRGRGRHRFDAQKANVLGELVELSRRQLRQAEARARGPIHVAFAYRYR